MSAVVAELAAVTMVMFLAIGGDTEDAMQEDVWEVAGLCEPLKATGRSCDYEDDTEECQAARARHRPCVFSLDNIIRMMKKGEDEDARAVREYPAKERKVVKRTWHCLPWIPEHPRYQKCTSKTEVVEEEAADDGSPRMAPGHRRHMDETAAAGGRGRVVAAGACSCAAGSCCYGVGS